MDGWSTKSGFVRWRACWIAVLAIVAVSLMGLAIAAQLKKSEPTVASFRLVAEYPHDPNAFTQGLVVVGGQMYEGTGKKGESTLRKVNLKTGKVELFVPLDPSYFGEGITILEDRIYQLTWQNRIGLVYDAKTLERVSTFRYAGEGWGLTHDGKRLIMSDGSATLRFIDPKTSAVVKRLRVRGPQGPIDKLNELEYVKGEILANIWYLDHIARISPETGELLGWIDLSTLYPAPLRPSKEDVLNGIAYDESSDRLFVTGKNWPKIYEIELTK
ncbi:MAG: glutaminyl-peptide cyclotransferase [Planctomycetes bacterium]|nr:glutaminyl-peptide cyclotransferase [Planctomycetota bacterium]